MKTATIPAVRVEPEFRDELESMLDEGETLSAFVEKALRESLHRRQTQAEFVKRGIAALDRYKTEGGRTYTVDEVVAELRAKTAAARAAKA
ncbi:YlcI/YnfO family protein [Paucibacter sp. R3-3]|uniref:YlcI/YnfO family protein n=1 Tax=Roseateles agri TaxID=3098619 RepID=A0ABU5DIB2_9BURK|nr:YlcI/YnfO family protein [Paucibacter sp. R3-3]MDY0746033.1 YlcI/YnfO family protein [Paucibacter sp. R3-3]